MTTPTTSVSVGREPELLGQTVAVIGASAGIGLETARRARAEGADVILIGRNRERLEEAARDLGALSTAAFNAHDPDALARFFDSLRAPIDHVMVTAGAPPYGRPLEIAPEEARRLLSDRLVLPLDVARAASGKVRPLGSLVFMGSSGERHVGPGLGIIATVSVGLPMLIANLALELAPIRVNLIAAGFVDTPLSASLLARSSSRRLSRSSRNAAHQAGCRPVRHRRAGRSHHEQHGTHRCDLRHRRGPAAGGEVTSGENFAANEAGAFISNSFTDYTPPAGYAPVSRP
jgi:NAD(P)-dependent dehydrogenase (short-subunit alcohol dehydrogenase family)